MEIGVNLLEIMTPELILGEIIIIVLFCIGAVWIYNKMMSRGIRKGMELQKNSDTADALKEHVDQCTKKGADVQNQIMDLKDNMDQRMDGFDMRLTSLETKIDMMITHFDCKPKKVKD